MPGVEGRRRIKPRGRWFLAASLALVVVGGVAGVTLVARGGDAPAGESPHVAGCTLTPSEFGYPDWYLEQQVEYTIHPRLPGAGWREPNEPVRFNALFHSVFHGYVVLQYRPDISPRTLAGLRSWVAAHARKRVTAAPAPDAPFAVDVAKWGHDLRCTSAAALTARKLDRFLALPRPES